MEFIDHCRFRGLTVKVSVKVSGRREGEGITVLDKNGQTIMQTKWNGLTEMYRLLYCAHSLVGCDFKCNSPGFSDLEGGLVDGKGTHDLAQSTVNHTYTQAVSRGLLTRHKDHVDYISPQFMGTRESAGGSSQLRW